MAARSSLDYLLLLAKGLAMGAADVVPGVSGGTIAFITGIYDELLHSLRNLGPHCLKILYREGFGAFWRHINGSFLLAVFAGVLISIKTFASIISFCLDSYPLMVWGLFYRTDRSLYRTFGEPSSALVLAQLGIRRGGVRFLFILFRLANPRSYRATGGYCSAVGLWPYVP